MCGRYALFDQQKLIKKYGLTAGPSLELPDRYNVAPRSNVPVIASGSSELEPMNWGLLPFYEKDPVKGRRIINAMAESVGVKPSFKSAYKFRRCVIPANGFYEWAVLEDHKQPFYFYPSDDGLFSFAGIYEVRPDAEGRPYKTFAIITVPANDVVRPVHDRMPAILTPAGEHDWLNPDLTEPEQLDALLNPYPAELMKSRPVSPLVNSPRNDGPELLALFK